MKRHRITQGYAPNIVHIFGPDADLTLYAPKNGGYVTDDRNGSWCKGFTKSGPCLKWTGGDSFIHFIRREWKRRKM